MGRLFGRDGIRGLAISEMSCELAMEVGKAAAAVLARQSGERIKILVGKDARNSGDALEAAVCAGLCSSGADAELVGVVPSPALAYLVKERSARGGIMISASHRSAEYNGIKLYGDTGNRLSFDDEEEIERLILDYPEELIPASGGHYGKTIRYLSSVEDYVRHVRSVSVSGNFSGMKVAIDCANGSASFTAGKIFSALGAEVLLTGNSPDGTNINRDCGCTHIEHLMNIVLEHRCSVGLAFDGGGERCLAVDDRGRLVDGDEIIALIAQYFKTGGILRYNTLPVTSGNNMGLIRFARRRGIDTVSCGAGERRLIRKLVENNYSIGGDSNGHILFPDDAPSADGQLTGVRLLEVLAQSGRRLSELTGIIEKMPQVIINVPISYRDHEVWKNDRRLMSFIEAVENELGDDGRIIVREVGREPVIRIHVEGPDFTRINTLALEVSDMVKDRCTVREWTGE